MSEQEQTAAIVTSKPKQVHVIFERGARADALPEEGFEDSALTAFFMDAKDNNQPDRFAQSWVAADEDLVQKNTEKFEDVVRGAEHVTEAVLDVAVQVFAGSDLGETIAAYRTALFLEWRERFIKVVKNVAMWSAAAEVVDWEHLTLSFKSKRTAMWLLPPFRTNYGESSVTGLHAGSELSEFAKATMEDERRAGLAGETVRLEDDHTSALDAFLADTPALSLPRDKSTYVVFVTRWGLKTVPPTLIPLIRAVEPRARILMVNRTSAGITAADINVPMSDGKSLREVGYMLESADFRSGARIRNGPLLDAILHKFQVGLAQADPVRFGGVDLTPMILNTLPELLSVSLPGIMSQIRSFEEFFARQTKAAVVVCPGRTSESAVIQEAARRHGIGSIDVMNAYMSHGYTYTSPLGDYATAIDTWSKDLLMQRFGIPEERVLSFGTPRFDQVPEEVSGASKSFTTPTVVIATQPLVQEHMCRVIEALSLMSRGSTPIRFIVKMHPREAIADEESYRRAVSPETPHSFEFVRNRDIYEVMREANAVVVLFSNVGVEAALMNLPLVIAKLDMEEMPLPLDEFGIGATANSPEALRESLTSLLYDESFAAEISTMRRRYIEENPFLAERKSTEAITQAILLLLEGDRAAIAELRKADAGSLSLSLSAQSGG